MISNQYFSKLQSTTETASKVVWQIVVLKITETLSGKYTEVVLFKTQKVFKTPLLMFLNSFENFLRKYFFWPILRQCSISITLEYIRKSEVFGRFQGCRNGIFAWQGLNTETVAFSTRVCCAPYSKHMSKDP